MKIEAKFNKQKAKLVEVCTPFVSSAAKYPLGIVAMFTEMLDGEAANRSITLHLTPSEAFEFAEYLITAARLRLKNNPNSLNGNQQ